MTVQQASVTVLEHLSFLEIVTAQPHIHCVWFNKKSSEAAEPKRCGRTLSSPKIQNIKDHLAQLLSGRDHVEADLRRLFVKLASYALCGRAHHKKKEFEGVHEEMATRWTKEFPGLDLTAFVLKPLTLEKNALSYQSKVTITRPSKRPKPRKEKESRPIAWKRTISGDRVTLYDASMDDASNLLHSSPAGLHTPQRTRPSSFVPFNPRLPICPTYRVQSINDKIISYLRRPLTPRKGLEFGHIYMFTRPCDPGYVKIGYTSEEPEQRIARWQQGCSYEAMYQFATIKFANAYQVEQLVHRELEAVRMRERVCKYGRAKCEKEHEEWFRVEVEDAKRVIKRWVRWALGLQSENSEDLDGRFAVGASITDQPTPWTVGKLSLHDDWKALLDEYTHALDDGHHDPNIWEKWVRKKKLRDGNSPASDSPPAMSCCEPSVASPQSQDPLIKQILALSQMQLSLAVSLSNASPTQRAQAVQLLSSLMLTTPPVVQPTTPLPQTPIARSSSPDIFSTPQSSPSLRPSSISSSPTIESPPELVWDLSSPSPSPSPSRLSDPFGPQTPSPQPYRSVSGYLDARSGFAKT